MKNEIEDSLTSLERNKSKIFNIFAVLTVAVFAAYALWFSFNGSSISTDPAHWGEFGDYVGGILNPIYGFFTVIMLLITLIQQQKSLLLSHRELELSRKELELTRNELEGSKEALKQQSKSFHIQNFENRLFILLENLINNLKEIKVIKPIDSKNIKAGIEFELTGDKALEYIIQHTVKAACENYWFKVRKYSKNKRPEYINDYDYTNILQATYDGILKKNKLLTTRKATLIPGSIVLLQNDLQKALRQLAIITRFIAQLDAGQDTKNEYYEIVANNISESMLIAFFLYAAFEAETRASITDSKFFKYLPGFIPSDNNKQFIDLKVLKRAFSTDDFGDNVHFTESISSQAN